MSPAIAPCYPITALSKEVKSVKADANEGPVRITENGRGAYVFIGEKAFAELIQREREDAAYEAYLLETVGRGVMDVEAGRTVNSREAMFAEAARRREARDGADA